MKTASPADLVKVYRVALAKLETARRELKAINTVVVDVALRLMDWTRLVDGSSSPLIAAPWEKGQLTIDRAEWPGADFLATAVDVFHATRAESIAAYDAIPEEQRKGLVLPPR